MEDRIILPKRRDYVGHHCIAINGEAYKIFKDITKRTSMPAKQVASSIIIQAVEKGLIAFEDEEEEDEVDS